MGAVPLRCAPENAAPADLGDGDDDGVHAEIYGRKVRAMTAIGKEEAKMGKIEVGMRVAYVGESCRALFGWMGSVEEVGDGWASVAGEVVPLSELRSVEPALAREPTDHDWRSVDRGISKKRVGGWTLMVSCHGTWSAYATPPGADFLVRDGFTYERDARAWCEEQVPGAPVLGEPSSTITRHIITRTLASGEASPVLPGFTDRLPKYAVEINFTPSTQPPSAEPIVFERAGVVDERIESYEQAIDLIRLGRRYHEQCNIWSDSAYANEKAMGALRNENAELRQAVVDLTVRLRKAGRR